MFGGYNPYDMFMNSNQKNPYMPNSPQFPPQNFNYGFDNNFGGNENNRGNQNDKKKPLNPFSPLPGMPFLSPFGSFDPNLFAEQE
jgi:hypothetical protein